MLVSDTTITHVIIFNYVIFLNNCERRRVSVVSDVHVCVGGSQIECVGVCLVFIFNLCSYMSFRACLDKWFICSLCHKCFCMAQALII